MRPSQDTITIGLFRSHIYGTTMDYELEDWYCWLVEEKTWRPRGKLLPPLRCPSAGADIVNQKRNFCRGEVFN